MAGSSGEIAVAGLAVEEPLAEATLSILAVMVLQSSWVTWGLMVVVAPHTESLLTPVQAYLRVHLRHNAVVALRNSAVMDTTARTVDAAGAAAAVDAAERAEEDNIVQDSPVQDPR